MTTDFHAKPVNDDRREAIIAYYEAQMMHATTCEEKRAWWVLMAREMNKLSGEAQRTADSE